MTSIKTYQVRGKTIGGSRPLICAPIVAKSAAELPRAVAEILALAPDLVEWRADYLAEIEDGPAVLAALAGLREGLEAFPLIFTCRVDREGGASSIPEERRLRLIGEVIDSGKADLVDIELCTEEGALRGLIARAKAKAVLVIVSNHDFKATPPLAEMVERMRREQELGADIAKIAVMPTCAGDILDLLAATREMREEHARIPLMTMSMSALGVISRVSGATFGSAITFGSGRAASAPGQIPVAELRAALDILEGKAKA